MIDMAGKDDISGRSKARTGLRARRRFGRDEDGSVVIEFAVLIVPFCLLVFAILESCITFAAQQVLSNATDDVARQFRTGQIKPADVVKNPTLVSDKICAKLEVLVSSGCPELEIDLKSFTSFKDAADKKVLFNGTGKTRDINTDDFSIDPGMSGSKNQLRVFYRWPVMTDFMRKSMSNLKDGKTLLYATVTWQNEPFED
jgi:Flp pilus assembly protein TadG